VPDAARAQYLEEADSFAGMLAQPEIKAAYEAQLPVALKALLHLTCTAHVSDASLASAPAAFSLDQLAARSSAAQSYLAGAGAEGFGMLRHVGLVVQTFSDVSGVRGVALLALPALCRVVVLLLQGNRAAPRELHRVAVEDLFLESVATETAEDDPYSMREFTVEVRVGRGVAEGSAVEV